MTGAGKYASQMLVFRHKSDRRFLASDRLNIA